MSPWTASTSISSPTLTSTGPTDHSIPITSTNLSSHEPPERIRTTLGPSSAPDNGIVVSAAERNPSENYKSMGQGIDVALNLSNYSSKDRIFETSGKNQLNHEFVWDRYEQQTSHQASGIKRTISRAGMFQPIAPSTTLSISPPSFASSSYSKHNSNFKANNCDDREYLSVDPFAAGITSEMHLPHKLRFKPSCSNNTPNSFENSPTSSNIDSGNEDNRCSPTGQNESGEETPPYKRMLYSRLEIKAEPGDAFSSGSGGDSEGHDSDYSSYQELPYREIR